MRNCNAGGLNQDMVRVELLVEAMERFRKRGSDLATDATASNVFYPHPAFLDDSAVHGDLADLVDYQGNFVPAQTRKLFGKHQQQGGLPATQKPGNLCYLH
jgi:hypothetical protein